MCVATCKLQCSVETMLACMEHFVTYLYIYYENLIDLFVFNLYMMLSSALFCSGLFPGKQQKAFMLDDRVNVIFSAENLC